MTRVWVATPGKHLKLQKLIDDFQMFDDTDNLLKEFDF